MYRLYPSIVLGFHICEKKLADRIFAGKDSLTPSTNDYDWLGNGVYFWENSPDRAMQFANDLKGTIYEKKNPAVVGAVINLARCFDLTDSYCLNVLKQAFQELKSVHNLAKTDLPENIPLKSSKDLLLRRLDCAVIEFMHYQLVQRNEPQFDTVRGVFWEGKELYPNAGFKEKNHIQICVRNPNCIKGYFRPLKKGRIELYSQLN